MNFWGIKTRKKTKKTVPKLKPVSFAPKKVSFIPSIKKNKKIKKINLKTLTWPQAKKRFPNLSPFGDVDKDGVMNFKDCRPFDKNKQDFKYKGKVYPDTVLTKKHYRPRSSIKFQDVRKVNLKISKKDLDKTTAYYNTIDKVIPGTIDYLKKSKTIVEVGDQGDVFRAAAYLPQGKKKSRGRLYITTPQPNFHGNVAEGWSKEKQAEFQVKDEVKNVAHEMGHLKRDIEMGKRGIPAGKRFETGGWKNKKYFERKELEGGGYEVNPISAEAKGYEEEAEKYKERVEKQIDSKDISPREIYIEEIDRNKKYKEEVEEQKPIEEEAQELIEEDYDDEENNEEEVETEEE